MRSEGGLRQFLAVLTAIAAVLGCGVVSQVQRWTGVGEHAGGWATPAGAALAWPKSPARKPAAKPPASSNPERDINKPSGSREQPSGRSDADPAERTRENSWSIVLMSFRDDNRDASAAAALDAVRSRGGLPEAYLEERGKATVVALGRFASADDPAARAELTRVQAIEIEGARPYAAAILAPPLRELDEGSTPRYHLSMARALHGDSAIQTLQVAVYGPTDNRPLTEKDRAEIRRAAEQATVILRQEGEEAYYFHGPTRSMVTIGAFTIEDFDPQLPKIQSLTLQAVRKRHPYNLVNGAAAIERRPGPGGKQGEGKPQPSMLVAIPDDDAQGR